MQHTVFRDRAGPRKVLVTVNGVIRDQIRMMRTMKGTRLSSCTHHQSHYDNDEDKEVDRDFCIITMLISS